MVAFLVQRVLHLPEQWEEQGLVWVGVGVCFVSPIFLLSRGRACIVCCVVRYVLCRVLPSCPLGVTAETF